MNQNAALESCANLAWHDRSFNNYRDIGRKQPLKRIIFSKFRDRQFVDLFFSLCIITDSEIDFCAWMSFAYL